MKRKKTFRIPRKIEKHSYRNWHNNDNCPNCGVSRVSEEVDRIILDNLGEFEVDGYMIVKVEIMESAPLKKIGDNLVCKVCGISTPLIKLNSNRRIVRSLKMR